MGYLNLIKKKKNKSGAITFEEADDIKLQRLIVQTELPSASKSNLHELLMLFTKVMSLYDVTRHKITTVINKKTKAEFRYIENEVKKQNLIVNTIFKLVKEGCITSDEILNYKNELVVNVAKIENKIIQFFTKVIHKKEQEKYTSTC